jgi:flagellar secretion chaperone FliS
MAVSVRHALNAYANVGLETGVAAANPHRLILMLYEGALAAINRAETEMRAGNIAEKGRLISRAIQIIGEGLSASLDTANGGEIALQLQQLYDYMCRRLLFASMRNEPAGLVEVAKLLTELKSAWQAISDHPPPGLAPNTEAPPAAAGLKAYAQNSSVNYGKV